MQLSSTMTFVFTGVASVLFFLAGLLWNSLRSARAGDKRAADIKDAAEAELMVLRAQTDRLKVALAGAHAAAEEKQRRAIEATVESVQTQLAQTEARAAAAEAKVAQSEPLREEVRRLRARADSLSGNGKTVADLNTANARLKAELSAVRSTGTASTGADTGVAARIRELEAALFAAGAPIPGAEALPVLGTSVSEGALDAALSRLTEGGTMKVAVIADREGFLLGAAGDRHYHEALAVASCVVDDFAGRLHTEMPFGRPTRVEIHGSHHLRLSTRLFAVGVETLSLTTVGTGTPTDAQVEAVLASIVVRGAA